MIFDVNQTTFPTPRHKAIWDLGRQIVPLGISLADITDPEIREGCMQIYNWTQDYYEDIFNNPDKYSGYTPYEMFRLLDDVVEGQCNTTVDYLIVGNKSGYNKRLLNLKKTHLPDLPLLFELNVSDDSETIFLTCKKYPLFCKYFKLFYKTALARKLNRIEYLIFNDFRVLALKYNRTFDDLLRVLPDKFKEYAVELHEYVLSKGAKLEAHKNYGRFFYYYKKNHLLELSQGISTPLKIESSFYSFRTVENSFEKSYKSYMEIAESQLDYNEIITCIQNGIRVCNACGIKKKIPKRCGIWKDIHGKRRLICKGGIISVKRAAPLSLLDYNDYDIKMMKRLLDIRCEQIDNFLK